MPVQDVYLRKQDELKQGGVSLDDEDLDYKRPLDPPLEPDDASWADALLRSQGRR